MHAPLNAAQRVEWRRLDGLADIAGEMQALADRAVEPNVFYDPAFLLAAAPVFGKDAGALLVRSAAGRLTGLFPARSARWRGGLRPMLIGWTHSFAPLGTPLVDRDDPQSVIAAWLDFVGESALPATILVPYVPETGAFAKALDAVLERSGRRHVRLGHHERALLDPAERGGYFERTLSAGRRKELRRQRRRLEEIAPVTFASATSGDEVEAALKDFCVLEASGWKGMAGTAIVNDAAVNGFVRSAVTELAARGRARIERLFLNGRAIAAVIMLQSGDTTWCWKIAYNEGVGRYSPGVQLVLDATERLLAGSEPVHVDSCAKADHPMIDHIWQERLALSDRLIATRPSSITFGMAYATETARRSALAAARRVRDRIRR